MNFPFNHGLAEDVAVFLGIPGVLRAERAAGSGARPAARRQPKGRRKAKADEQNEDKQGAPTGASPPDDGSDSSDDSNDSKS